MNFRIVALTHRVADLDLIGKFHLDLAEAGDELRHLKETLDLDELFFLSTCNRIEFAFVTDQPVDTEFVQRLFRTHNPDVSNEDIIAATEKAEVFRNERAVEHIFGVACSVDSLVIGEREIITQVRRAFETCRDYGLTGDTIRLVMRKTIENAKRVFTETGIASNPVSVVSLAYRKLRDSNVPEDARFLIVGSGQTNTTMARFLHKHGFTSFKVFNRTLENAKKLADEIDGEAKPLEVLKDHEGGFDVLITCTAATQRIITPNIYDALLEGDKDKKIVIDLAVPGDLDPIIVEKRNLKYIDVEYLKELAERNLKARQKELVRVGEIIQESIDEFREMYQVRQVELAMRAVPNKVKGIKEKAMTAVFARQIEELDDKSKEVLEDVINYMEKKYMSEPMKLAKDILIEKKKAV